MSINTIRELFDHYDWANQALYAIALRLSEEQLDRPFHASGDSLGAMLWRIYAAEKRDAFIAARTEPDLRQPTRAFARKDDPRRFPPGVTMLQLCCHGTHHRAPAAFMLQRLGAPTPALTWIYWTIAA